MIKQTKSADLAIKQAIKEYMVRKASTIGEFTDVDTEEKSAQIMKMANEMASLPKYQEVKDKIRSANGIVNFVTGNQYQPLVERLLQLAVPPSQNDVYHMGVNFTIPGDYDVDARNYFGMSGADRATQVAAITELENLVLGSPLKKNPQYFYDLGFNDAKLNDLFGPQIWAKIKQAFDRLAAREAEIERGQLKQGMATAHRKITEAYQIIKRNEIIRKKNKDNANTPNYSPQPEFPTLGSDEINKLKRQFEEFRRAYLQLKQDAPAYVARLIASENTNEDTGQPDRDTQLAMQRFLQLVAGGDPHSFSTKISRNQDGFMDFNPSSEFIDLFNRLATEHDNIQRNPQSREQMASTLSSFMAKLKAYSSGDRSVLMIKQKILDTIGETDARTQVENYLKNKATVNKLIYDMLQKVKQHGSVIIFSNVDNSILTNPQTSNPDDQRTISAINAVMRQFKGKIESQEEKLHGRSAVLQSRKLIILISSSPIRSLSDDAIIVDMSDLPVDSEEAAVIVRNILEADFGRDYREITLYNEESKIEKKYNDLMSKGGTDPKTLRAQKAREIYLLDATIESSFATSKPQDDAIKEIEEMIVGLGQKQAIDIVRKTLRQAVSYDTDPETESPSTIKLEGNKWVANVMLAANRQHDDNVPGLSTRRGKVKFEDYIFAKKSSDPNDLNPLKWGDTVGSFAQKHREYMITQLRIRKIDDDIVAIDRKLVEPGISPESKLELEILKANYWDARQRLVEERKVTLKALPHFMILYGKPGVGKTVFADALANLFGFVIRSVNFDQAKDKWVGNTEKFTKRIIDVIKSSRNAVVLIDELDRSVRMDAGSAGGGGGGSDQSTHPVDAGIVKQLLQLTEDNSDQLVEQNVFIIITTNFLGNFDKALESRAQRQGGVYEVQAPNDPEDYKRFLDTFLRTEKKDTPKAPWLTLLEDYMDKSETEIATAELSKIRNRKVTIEDYWQELDSLIRSVDMDKLCRILAERRLGFRALSAMIRKGVLMHNSFLISRNQIARGESTEVLGMPFNTANLVKAAMVAKDGSDNLTENTDGVSEVAAELRNSVNERLKSGKLELKEQIEILPPHKYSIEQVLSLLREGKAVIVKSGLFEGINELGDVCLVDPATKQPKRDPTTKRIEPSTRIARVHLDINDKIVRGYQLPEGLDLEKEMTAKPEAEGGDISGFEIGEQVVGDPNDPNARRIPYIKRPQQKQPPVGRTMEELTDSGMQDVSIDPSATEVPEESQNQPTREPVIEETGVPAKKNDKGKKTSTTDYYYQFLKNSGVFEKKAQVQQAVQQAAPAQEQQWYDEYEKNGVYYFGSGQVFVAPAGPDEKPQYLSITKGKR